MYQKSAPLSPDQRTIAAAVETVAILPTRANDLVRPIYEQMPVILASVDCAGWLDSRPSTAEETQQWFRLLADRASMAPRHALPFVQGVPHRRLMADVLGELMRGNQFSQARLAKAAGMSQSTISAVLNGNRSLNKNQVLALAMVFGVSPNAFLRR